MILSDSGNGNERSSTRSTTEKIAVLAPIPSASARTAMVVKAGLLIKDTERMADVCPEVFHAL
jgi:hypothetical protein